MKKSHVIQLIIVFMLVFNLLNLDFDNIKDYSANKVVFVNLMSVIFMLFFYLLEEGDKRKMEQEYRKKTSSKSPKGKAFGKRKEL